MNKIFFSSIVLFAILLAFTHTNFVMAESIGTSLGTINDLFIDGNFAYYFEHDQSKSSTFLHDTKIMKYDGEKSLMLSDELFMFPTELHIRSEFLYFAILSTSCEGLAVCDFQDIIKMSKNGDIKIIESELKSAVHISIDNDAIYVSESSGSIWKIGYIDGTKSLVFKSENIIMDLASNNDTIYWIEEIEDLNNRIMSISKNNNKEPKIISQNLQIPYDLKIIDNEVYWNDINVRGMDGTIAEVTKIMKYDKNKAVTLYEFKNTTPISKYASTPHYEPYLSAGEYIFAVNNTKTGSIIHMQNFNSKSIYDIDTLFDVKIKYLKAEHTSLYVIGVNEDGFALYHYTLPVSVPEFSSSIGIMMILSTVFIVFSLRVKSKMTF